MAQKGPHSSQFSDHVRRTVEILQRKTSLRPRLAVVLGSGFSEALDLVLPAVSLSYAELPGFVPPQVPGHKGELVVGHHKRLPLLVLKGRTHFYEGHTLQEITHPIRVLAEFGIKELLLTNAAGAIDRRLRPGQFMILSDHLNLMGDNPLRGSQGSNAFVDLTRAYDPELAKLLEKAGTKAKVGTRKGVYAALSGPSYETPAEIRALTRLGADAVGMSTLPEVIVARQCGIRVAALSCLTNYAAGRKKEPVSHAEVLQNAGKMSEKARRLLLAFFELYSVSLR